VAGQPDFAPAPATTAEGAVCGSRFIGAPGCGWVFADLEAALSRSNRTKGGSPSAIPPAAPLWFDAATARRAGSGDCSKLAIFVAAMPM
jgi:hypothetical protein